MKVHILVGRTADDSQVLACGARVRSQSYVGCAEPERAHEVTCERCRAAYSGWYTHLGIFINDGLEIACAVADAWVPIVQSGLGMDRTLAAALDRLEFVTRTSALRKVRPR